MPNSYHVNITNRAYRDIEAIFEYIQQESPQNAAKVIERILDAIDDLNFMPTRFRVAGKSRKRGNPIHARVMRPFIIYYRIDTSAQRVFIVEVRHGARRQPRRFE